MNTTKYPKDKYMINFAKRITKAAMRRGHYIFRVPVALTELSVALSFAQLLKKVRNQPLEQAH
jgi:hypothetical protein